MSREMPEDENRVETNQETYTLDIKVFPHEGGENVDSKATVTVPASAVEEYSLSDDITKLDGVGKRTADQLKANFELETVGEFVARLASREHTTVHQVEVLQDALIRLKDRYSIHEDECTVTISENGKTQDVVDDDTEDNPTIEKLHTDNDISPDTGYYLGERSDGVLEAYDPAQNAVVDIETHDLWEVESLSEYVAETHADWRYVDMSALGYAMRKADELAKAGLFTRAQSEVYALREIVMFSRLKTATILDISESGVDKHVRAARDKIESAQETVDILGTFEEGGA